MQELNGKKVFIDPGVLPESEMKKIIDNSSVDLSIITENRDIKDEFSRISGDIPTYLYPQLVEKSGGLLSKSIEKYNIWKEIIDDHQTYLLYDRAYFGIRSNQLKTADIISDCIACQRFIHDNKIDAIIYMATPHKLATWIFARTAELMGVDVYYFQETIMPWRQYLYKGVSRHAELVKFGFQTTIDNKAIKGFVEAKSSGFDEAFPETEKVKLRKNKGKFYNLCGDIKNSWKRPDNIVNKYLCYKKYSKISHYEVLPDKYVVYFLHYQPERTSLPEGYGFAQQLVAIRLLQNAIPEDCYLVVKEHPSTFTSLCGWKERRPSWYEQLQGEKILFAPMELDAYKLIDNSMAVSTLTGTIAGEALIRGKPAALLGAGPGLHVPHTSLHRFESYSKLMNFLANADKHNKEPNNEKTYKMLSEIAMDSFCGLTEEMDYTYANTNYETARIQCILNGFHHLLVVNRTACKVDPPECAVN